MNYSFITFRLQNYIRLLIPFSVAAAPFCASGVNVHINDLKLLNTAQQESV